MSPSKTKDNPGAAVTAEAGAQRAEPPVWRLVGETPLIHVELPGGAGGIGLKAEWFNPGGSVKDRPAREILRAGLAAGALPARRLLDASSGNTAVAYAMLGAAAGIGVTVCVPANASVERRELLAVFGAEVVLTDPMAGSDGAIRRACELAAQEPGRYWYADQYGNPANPLAHYRGTGPEIWRQTGGRVTHLVAGLGTSGTMMGAGRYLRQRNPGVRLVAVQPDDALHGLEGLKYMASAIVPTIYDPALPDETVFVATSDADRHVLELARGRGLFVGWSAGAAIAAARAILQRARDAGGDSPTVIVIAPDGGQRYLSEAPRRLAG